MRSPHWSTKTRGPKELDRALGVTIIWAVVVVSSFWPVRRTNLMPLAVSTLITAAVWAVVIAALRAHIKRNKTLARLRTLPPSSPAWAATTGPTFWPKS